MQDQNPTPLNSVIEQEYVCPFTHKVLARGQRVHFWGIGAPNKRHGSQDKQFLILLTEEKYVRYIPVELRGQILKEDIV